MNPISIYRIAIFFGITLTLTSCAVVNSDMRDATLASNEKGEKDLKEKSNKLAYFLPLGRLHIKGSVDSQDKGWVLVITPTYIPDVRHTCFFSYQASGLSEDDVKIDLTPQQFLLKIDSTTEDNSPKIIESAGKLAANIIKLASLAGGSQAAPNGPKMPAPFDIIIDPWNKSDRAALAKCLNGFDVSFKLDMDDHPNKDVNLSSSGIGYPNQGGTAQTGGIFYRPLLPYRITFTPTDDDYANHIGPVSAEVYLPNEAPVLSLHISRAAFAKNQTIINFTDGNLQNIEYKKPSEINGFVQIPITLTNQILSIPKDLLTLRIESLGNQNTLLNDQAALLKSQKGLIEAQADLIKTQKANAPAGSTSPSAIPQNSGSANGGTLPPGTTPE